MCITAAVVLITLALVSVFPGGLTINCYLCKSDQQPFCNDPFKGTKDTLHECSVVVNGTTLVWPDSECMKVVYSVKGAILYERQCTKGLMSNVSCTDVVQLMSSRPEATNDIELNYCNTCSMDGCNGVSRTLSTPPVLGVVSVVFAWMIVLD